MPRPNPGRTIGAETALKGAILAWMEAELRPTSWLALKMTEAGCPTSTQTCWKMLHTDRAVYVDEAIAINLVTGISLEPQGVNP